MASVVSAAVVSGELIIGLDDGSIIRAGYVQGPQGLSGPQGPMGATGSRGTDGNTIHTVKGPPPADLGKDGDYAINNRDWFIFGPREGGRWGAGKGMLPKDVPAIQAGKGATGGTTGGGGGSGGGGGTGPVFTNTVRLTDPTRSILSTTASYRVLPNAGAGKVTQQDANRWAFGEVFDVIDETIPVPIGENPPDLKYGGRLWFDSSEDGLTLYIYYGDEWVPAAPPVSLDGIESSITLLQETTAQLQTDVATTVLLAREEELKVLALQESQAQQDTKIEALETSQDAQDVRLDEVESRTNSIDSAIDNAAFVNQDNTFASNRTNTFKGNLASDKQLTIAAPSDTNFNPTFQIRGTARTGTKDSIVLRATNSNDRLRVTYRGPIDEDDEITTKKYVEDRLGGSKPDGPKAWKYTPIEKWNPGSVETGTFTIDKDNAKIYLNCHDEDGNWWVYRSRTETYTTPQPHFTVYAATGTMVWDASVHIADFYKVVNDQRITTLEYSSASSYYWNNYFKENHYFVIHFLSYLPNFRERHLEKLNPIDSTYVAEPDGLQLDEIEVQE